MPTINDKYSETEFQALLDTAEGNAGGDWESKFVDDLAKKFSRYGTRMFLSDHQAKKLEQIAHGKSGEPSFTNR